METVTLSEYFNGRDGLHILRPASRYERTPPRLVNPEATTRHIRNRYRRSMVVETPSEGVAIFPNATVFGSGVIRTEDGLILAESLERPGKGPLGRTDPDAPVARTFETAVHVGKRGNDNYGHFLVEQLPRLAMNAGAYPEDAPILLNRRSQGFALPLLARIGIGSERIERITDEPVLVETLYWPTRNAFHRLINSPHIFPFLRDLGTSIAEPGPAERMLFVGRRDAQTRQLVNDEEVFVGLEPHGFEWISPGHMPFEDQVQAFAEAKVVVAVGGAALTNMVFMPPGGAVVMLCSETMAGYLFWDLATHGGQELVVVFGENHDPRDTGKNADFRIDPGDVRAVVRDVRRASPAAVAAPSQVSPLPPPR